MLLSEDISKQYVISCTKATGLKEKWGDDADPIRSPTKKEAFIHVIPPKCQLKHHAIYYLRQQAAVNLAIMAKTLGKIPGLVY